MWIWNLQIMAIKCLFVFITELMGFPGVAHWYRIRLPMQEMKVQSLGWEDPLEKKMATCSSALAWKTPWSEEPGGL